MSKRMSLERGVKSRLSYLCASESLAITSLNSSLLKHGSRMAKRDTINKNK